MDLISSVLRGGHPDGFNDRGYDRGNASCYDDAYNGCNSRYDNSYGRYDNSNDSSYDYDDPNRYQVSRVSDVGGFIGQMFGGLIGRGRGNYGGYNQRHAPYYGDDYGMANNRYDRRYDPYGRDPYGRGYDPYGRDPYGRDPYRRGYDPYGRDPYGRDPYGRGHYDRGLGGNFLAQAFGGIVGGLIMNGIFGRHNNRGGWNQHHRGGWNQHNNWQQYQGNRHQHRHHGGRRR